MTSISLQKGTAHLDYSQLQDIYSPTYDLNRISEEQASAFKVNTLPTFPTAVLILLHFLTSGIFTTIYLGLKHSHLPKIKHDDFTAGKAIGFLFIPFYNIYWVFVFYLRLVDRINFQFRIRGKQAPISKGFAITVLVLMLIPFVNYVSALILMPILAGLIQSATNRIAKGQF